MFKLFAALWVAFVSLFASAAPVNKPLLFEIEKNGQKAFIFGTIHTGVEYKDLPTSVIKSLIASETIVLETNLAEANAVIQKTYPMPAPVSLRSQLNDAQWAALLPALAKFGVNEAIADTLYPFQAQSLFSLSNLPKTLQPIDATIAQTGGRAFEYLESPQSQLEILAAQFTIENLRQALDTPASEHLASSDRLVDTYYSGDPEALYSFMVDGISPEFRDILLTKRNHAWIPEIERIVAAPGEEFIAVGAGHLGGPDGILALLAQASYTVTRP